MSSARILCERRGDSLVLTPVNMTSTEHRIAKAICGLAWQEVQRGCEPMRSTRDALAKIRARGICVVIGDREIAMLGGA